MPKLDDVIIKPTTDLFIASLWSNPKNEAILLSLLNGVMTDIGMPKIVKATVLNPFNIQEFAADKQIRLDVRVVDESGAKYDVEVQSESHDSFHERMLYYWADMYGSQLKRGDDYENLCPVRSIVITDFPVFPKLKNLHAVFELRSRENPAVLLTDYLQIHFLRLGNLPKKDLSGLDGLSLPLQNWMKFWAFGSELKESEMSTMIQDPAVQDAYEIYQNFKSDPIAQERVRDHMRFMVEQKLRMGDAYRAGKAEGKAEGKADIACNLKAMGLPVSDIVRATGLSPAEIERL